MLSLKPTERGFQRAEFVDRYGSECSIQESSLMEPALWLGVDKDFNEDERPRGGHRMHLTPQMVKDLLPLLKHFVKTGYLPPAGQ